MKLKNAIVYLKVCKDHNEYLGERYFKLDWNSDKVVQVCLSNGRDVRRGRSNTIGVYLISKQTLFSNYMAMKYLEPCTKRAFEKQFQLVVDFLS